MKFDPTNNYYGIDISIEKNLIIWNFWELIKCIVTLSSPVDIQKKIVGIGAVADEMAMDFETYYTMSFQSYFDHELLTLNQISKLNLLDKFLENRSGDKMPEFWNDEILKSHSDWEKVRIMAKEILKTLKYDNLEIEFERSTQKTNSNKGESLLIEGTKTRLKIKTPTNKSYN